MIIYFFSDFKSESYEDVLTLVDWMPQQQQEIIARIKNSNNKREQVIAYTMLCHALKRKQNEITSPQLSILEFPANDLTNTYIKENAPIFSFGEYGKPHLTNFEGIHFNISHCREAIVVAVSNSNIGIDVEGRRRFSDAILKRSFNEEENNEILTSPDPENEFARQWTRKEAWFKYTGTGILLDHMKETASEALAKGCDITTLQVSSDTSPRHTFWLSIAQGHNL